MTATFPLQSCRMSASWLGLGNDRFRRREQPVDHDGARLRAAIEADTASRAVVPGVTRRMHSVGTQFGGEFQAFRRAGYNTKSASFALLNINRDIAECWTRHSFTLVSSPGRCSLHRLRMLQPFGLLAVLVKLGAEIGMRNLDEGFGPLANRLPVQVSNAVLGHDVTDQAARGDDTSSRIERGHDPRNGALFRS